jgi:hypothetical protein
MERLVDRLVPPLERRILRDLDNRR